jgi:hypothetical protein
MRERDMKRRKDRAKEPGRENERKREKEGERERERESGRAREYMRTIVKESSIALVPTHVPRPRDPERSCTLEHCLRSVLA